VYSVVSVTNVVLCMMCL